MIANPRDDAASAAARLAHHPAQASMSDMHEPDLSDEQWASILPLLPQGRVRHTDRGRMRSDRFLFAVIAAIVGDEQPWTTGLDYGLSARTLQQQWAEYHEAGVFARMAALADAQTAIGQWALLVAQASDKRALRSGYAPAGPMRAMTHRRAWQLQNAFPEGS
jgi:transposase